jgi:hypothetical protein
MGNELQNETSQRQKDEIRSTANLASLLGIFAGPLINSMGTTGRFLPFAVMAGFSCAFVCGIVDSAQGCGAAIRVFCSRFKGRRVDQSRSEQLANAERFRTPEKQIPLRDHLKAAVIGAAAGAPAVAATALPVPLSLDTKAAAAGVAVAAVSESLLFLGRGTKTGKGHRSAAR